MYLQAVMFTIVGQICKGAAWKCMSLLLTNCNSVHVCEETRNQILLECNRNIYDAYGLH